MSATEQGHSVSAVLHEVIDRVGLPFGLSIAQRAQLCADELLGTGDEEAIRYMLAEGWERELSRQFTEARRVAKRAGKDMVAGGGEAEPVARQLAFPVVAPGKPPVPLARATHAVIAAALDAEETQLRGRQRNIALLRRAAFATQRWPDKTVAELLAARLISPEQLFEATG
jgi:hypothetical protein